VTLEEALARIGERVIYQPFGGVRERGVIDSVGGTYVYVRYDGDPAWPHVKATAPADLALAAERGAEEDGCPGCESGGGEDGHLAGCENGPGAWKSHSPGCNCPDCAGAREDAGETEPVDGEGSDCD
jgi:hypothetical protein